MRHAGLQSSDNDRGILGSLHIAGVGQVLSELLEERRRVLRAAALLVVEAVLLVEVVVLLAEAAALPEEADLDRPKGE